MRKIFITTILCLFTLTKTFAVSTPEQIKTLFVFNFIKYIEWNNKPSTVTIAYLGEADGLFEAFSEMASQKSTGNVKITVKIIADPKESSNYHLVYIPANNSKVLSEIPPLLNTVVVTEKDGLGKKGSYINFVNQEGKIRFEINKAIFSASTVKISSQLLSLAIAI